MKLLWLFALAACGRTESRSTVDPPPPVVRGDAAVIPTPFDAAAIPATVIPSGAKELITAVVDDWTSTRATLRRWKRAGAAWRADGEPWPGVVGKGGTAWGAGLHGTGALTERTGPVKREGDGKSPAGAFALRSSYGYAKAPPAGTKLPYIPLDEPWKCVDDPASTHYARILDRRTVATVDWKSAEDMRRADDAYEWVVDVAHNPASTAGSGSCIFLHVWRGPDSATVGCTAMDKQKLADLLATMDPSAIFVLLPRAEYDALAASWGLPHRFGCADVCKREAACIVETRSTQPFDEKECAAACAALAADAKTAGKLQQHIDCVAKQSACADVLQCK